MSYGPEVDLALSTWVKLARAYSSVSKRSEDHIRSSGLTPAQFGVLECLGHKGSMCLGELGRKHLVSAGNMTVVVDNLEKEGLVERVRVTEDRRQILVRLTETGEAMFRKLFPGHARYMERVMSSLSATEQKTLSGLLKKLGMDAQQRDPALPVGSLKNHTPKG